ncbi:hypothetical protein ONS96_011743 [Cadophora gregata f. sp. sojae]|nr:hypothetical protein ONS96_011743 [Cadophora gregata f. sp. sojae]
MSLTQPPGGFGGPQSGYGYPAGNDRPRPPPPTLPSMSSLLNQEPLEQQPRHNQFMPQQYPPQYSNMSNQSHPLWQSQQDPNAPAPSEPMFMQLEGQHTLARLQRNGAPSPKHDQELRSEFPQRLYPAQVSRSPSQASFEPEETLSRRQSTFSEASSRSMPQVQTARMPISNLLSAEPSPSMDRPAPKYTLRMRQQPVAARACGFGERDRRVIDPPPILQMNVTAPHLSAAEVNTLIRSPFSVIHCILWDSDNNCDATAMPGTTDKRQQRRLMGTLVSSPFFGKDEHNVDGCFFTFPDLSVRTPGKYSLKFSLVSLDPARMRPGQSEPVRAFIISSDFQVLNAKDFRGMRASTALTKTLKHQGCLISVKKGNSKNNRDDEEEDDEDDDDDGDNSKRKRSKR